MGLAIRNYSASYHQLHVLREWALKAGGVFDKDIKEIYDVFDETPREDWPKVSKFYSFINHSDCDGGYISFSKFGITELPENMLNDWGDLDRLKEEVEALKEFEDQLEQLDREAWEAFKEDVEEEDAILLFR